MSKTHHRGKEGSGLHRFLWIEFVQLELEVLGHELAYEDGAPEQGARPHSLSQKGRNVQSAFDDSLCLVLWHLGTRRGGG